ncbi:MAG: type II secretion system F family protein [Acidimicrobiales bacterium]
MNAVPPRSPLSPGPPPPVVLAKPKKSLLKMEITPKKVKSSELMNFSRQAAAFLRAGIPVLEALGVLADETKNKLLRKILIETLSALRAGSSLGAGLARYPGAFPNYYIPMVRSAELTGSLDTVLDQLAIYIERDLEAKRKVKSALTYPTVVAVLSVVSVVILAAWVLPKFEVFFAGLDADLPLATRMLLGITDVFMLIWPLLAGGAALVVLAFVVSIRTAQGRYIRDRMLLRAPVIGSVVRFAIVERFCRVLAALVTAGVPLPDALVVASNGTGNTVFQRGLAKAREAMIRGEGLARPLAALKLFPAGANQMIRVGEVTGTLDQQLEFAAGFYERELNYRLKKFTDLFEPAVILFMGLVVGFVAIALVSAMYGIFSEVNTI